VLKSLAIGRDQRSTGDTFDAPVERAPGFVEVERQIVGQYNVVEFARDTRYCKQGAKPSGEGNKVLAAVKKQRSLAETVARQDQSAGFGVPLREGEGADAAGNAGIAPAFEHTL